LRTIAPLAAGALGAFTAVTGLFFVPWLLRINSALVGPPGDNLQDYWNTWYGATQVTSRFFFTKLIRFPAGTPLYYHSFDYPQVAAVAILSRLLGTSHPTLLLLHNVTLLASFPLAGVGAFFLTRHFTRDILGASAGGFIFAFSPWHVEQAMQHAHVSSIEFIPVFVLAYLLALERKSAFWLSVAIAFYLLSALSSWYYLVYIAYFLLFHFFITAIQRPDSDPYWTISVPIACIAVVLAILSPLIVPMVAQAMRGASVYTNPADSRTYVADIAAYVAFPPTHALARLGKPIYQRLSGNPWEATVYLGIVNLATIAWAWRWAETAARKAFAYLFAGMASFAVLASGDELHFLGYRLIAMPNSVLSALPILANVRTPSRAIVFVYLFLAVSCGLAVRLISNRNTKLVAHIGLASVLLLMFLDFSPMHLDATLTTCKPGWSVIRGDTSAGYGILMLPRGIGDIVENFYMQEQAACHGRPIVQGITSRKVVTGLLEGLNTRDLTAQKKQLANSKVKYIVIDDAIYWESEDGDRAQYLKAYPIVYAGEGLTILRVY